MAKEKGKGSADADDASAKEQTVRVRLTQLKRRQPRTSHQEASDARKDS